jgi:hypothetical protein
MHASGDGGRVVGIGLPRLKQRSVNPKGQGARGSLALACPCYDANDLLPPVATKMHATSEASPPNFLGGKLSEALAD